MNDFERFKAAVALLAECAADAATPTELMLAIAARQDNPFHDLDFWATACALRNAVEAGLDLAMNVLGPEGEEEGA